MTCGKRIGVCGHVLEQDDEGRWYCPWEHPEDYAEGEYEAEEDDSSPSATRKLRMESEWFYLPIQL